MAAVVFARETLERLADAMEVQIETHGTDAHAHRTTIWVVVVEGVPSIRSYRGHGARWYREILAHPASTLHVGREALPVRAVPAIDEGSRQACSRGFAEKYAGDPATRAMVRDEVLDTTLRLEPASN